VRHRSLVLVSLVGALLTPAGTASASPNPTLSADPSAANVTAYRGILAWSRQTPEGRFRLVIMSSGVVRDAEIPDFAHPVNADLGPDQAGSVVAVYARCETPRRCDLYSLRPDSDEERRLSSVSSATLAETAPSTYGRRLAFAESRSAPAGAAARRPALGLFVTRPQRLFSRRTPLETDLDRRRVVFVARKRGMKLIAERQLRRRAKTCEVVYDETDGGSGADLHSNPVLANGYVYWLHRSVGGNAFDYPGGEVPADESWIERLRLPRRGCSSRRDTGGGKIQFGQESQELAATSVAVDGSLGAAGFFYTDSEGVKQATGDEVRFSTDLPF
jgi:hypothetical protein